MRWVEKIRELPLPAIRAGSRAGLGARGRSYPSVTHTRVAMRALTLAASGCALTSPGGVAPRGVPLLAGAASSANEMRAVVGHSSQFNACCGPAQSIGARCARASRSFLTHLLASLAIALCTVWSHGQAAETSPTSALPADQAALLEEYRTNYRRLIECYNSIRIEAVGHLTPPEIPGQKPRPATKTHFIYRSNAGQFFRMDAAKLGLDDELPTGTMGVTLVRPEGFLVAHRDRPDGPFVPRQWSNSPQEGLGHLTSDRFHRAVYCYVVSDLEPYVLGRPYWAKIYTIEKVESHLSDGERLVTLTSRAVPEKGKEEWLGRFVFLRDRAWALKEYECGIIDRGKGARLSRLRKARCEYEGMYQGVPLLKRVEYSIEDADPRIVDREVYEVRSIVPGPVPEREFTLEALGIKMGRQHSNWITCAVLGLSGVFLVALFFILRRRKRRA